MRTELFLTLTLLACQGAPETKAVEATAPTDAVAAEAAPQEADKEQASFALGQGDTEQTPSILTLLQDDRKIKRSFSAERRAAAVSSSVQVPSWFLCAGHSCPSLLSHDGGESGAAPHRLGLGGSAGSAASGGPRARDA